MDRKIIDRVEKLLRLAAPSSGTTEPERISAALEAARVFSENNLIVSVKEEPKRKTRRTSSPPVPWSPPSWVARPSRAPPEPGWVRSHAPQEEIWCPLCERQIHFGDAVWMRMKSFKLIEYIHDNCV